ncbi:hypothetical protein [Anaerosporobacter sp.]|uniref:hypothetical protein n=1 Tax=Anaerosporobacter sp. TaxID=1872529 RepID=UPI00286ED8A5|nr:hypothetical protein [Anaerosporobacter sp.]
MCTSFTWRKDNVLVGMNFDNNGVPFSLSMKDPRQFVVCVGGAPCFGVNSNGSFINHLMVDSNEDGGYKRGKNIVHTIKLMTDILSNKLAQENIGDFLSEKEVVNVPNHSCHSMISDKSGNVWIVEPGRGIMYSPADESSYCLMTNFSLHDYKLSGNIEGSGMDRYKSADYLLSNANDLDVAKAFEILEAAKQSEGEWLTAFSMVYSQKENAVYYCYNGDYQNIQKFVFG